MIHDIGRPNHRLRPVASLPIRTDKGLADFVDSLYSSSSFAHDFGSANPYALMPDSLHFIERLLDVLSPGTVLEFGGGESTKLLVPWARQNGCRIVTIEHDRQFVVRLRREPGSPNGDHWTLIHAPLRYQWHGCRLFFTYRDVMSLKKIIAAAGLILIDGPHQSGREPVLYAALSFCRAQTWIVVDDFNLYFVRDMLATLPMHIRHCFIGTAIVDNSHGLYILKCISEPSGPVGVPYTGLLESARTLWRCLRDRHQYGTGD